MHLTHFSLARHTSVGRDRESDPASSSVYTRLLVSSGGMTSANQWEITCQHHQSDSTIHLYGILAITHQYIKHRTSYYIYYRARNQKLIHSHHLRAPPELYQSSGTLWRWVYATFRFFYIYIARLFIYLGSFGPTPHPSTPAHQQKKYTGEIKKSIISFHVAKI